MAGTGIWKIQRESVDSGSANSNSQISEKKKNGS
jgi:hypothetical protein